VWKKKCYLKTSLFILVDAAADDDDDDDDACMNFLINY
jgi:hypothetical protein